MSVAEYTSRSIHSGNTKQPLNAFHFAYVTAGGKVTKTEVLQCIWCGMFVEQQDLAFHFEQVHKDVVHVPKCNLCVRELVINGLMKVYIICGMWILGYRYRLFCRCPYRGSGTVSSTIILHML